MNQERNASHLDDSGFLLGPTIISSYIPTCTSMHEQKKTSVQNFLAPAHTNKEHKANGEHENEDKKEKMQRLQFYTSPQTAWSVIYLFNRTEWLVALEMCTY